MSPTRVLFFSELMFEMVPIASLRGSFARCRESAVLPTGAGSTCPDSRCTAPSESSRPTGRVESAISPAGSNNRSRLIVFSSEK